MALAKLNGVCVGRYDLDVLGDLKSDLPINGEMAFPWCDSYPFRIVDIEQGKPYRIPATWWDRFKARWFPKWLERRFPVPWEWVVDFTYRVETIEERIDGQ